MFLKNKILILYLIFSAGSVCAGDNLKDENSKDKVSINTTEEDANQLWNSANHNTNSMSSSISSPVSSNENQKIEGKTPQDEYKEKRVRELLEIVMSNQTFHDISQKVGLYTDDEQKAAIEKLRQKYNNQIFAIIPRGISLDLDVRPEITVYYGLQFLKFLKDNKFLVWSKDGKKIYNTSCVSGKLELNYLQDFSGYEGHKYKLDGGKLLDSKQKIIHDFNSKLTVLSENDNRVMVVLRPDEEKYQKSIIQFWEICDLENIEESINLYLPSVLSKIISGYIGIIVNKSNQFNQDLSYPCQLQLSDSNGSRALITDDSSIILFDKKNDFQPKEIRLTSDDSIYDSDINLGGQYLLLQVLQAETSYYGAEVTRRKCLLLKINTLYEKGFVTCCPPIECRRACFSADGKSILFFLTANLSSDLNLKRITDKEELESIGYIDLANAPKTIKPSNITVSENNKFILGNTQYDRGSNLVLVDLENASIMNYKDLITYAYVIKFILGKQDSNPMHVLKLIDPKIFNYLKNYCIKNLSSIIPQFSKEIINNILGYYGNALAD